VDKEDIGASAFAEMTGGVEEDRLTGVALSGVAQDANVLRVRGRFHTGQGATFVASPGRRHDRDAWCRSFGLSDGGDQRRRSVRSLGSQWSAASRIGDS